MAYIVLGVGVGCWMYAFVNKQWNNDPWISSAPFFWIGLVAIILACVLFIV